MTSFQMKLSDLNRKKIQIFKSVFKGRDDAVMRNENGKWRKWQSFMGQDIQLSDELLWGHLTGELFLGIYPLFRDNTCHFLAVDFDNHTGNKAPAKDVEAYRQVCEFHGIHVYTLKSKSGTGYHSYFFLKGAVPARKVRLVSSFLLEEAAITQDSSYDKIFPAQDVVNNKGYGNAISLPFQGQAAKKGLTIFVDPATNYKKPYGKQQQMQILHSIKRYDETFFESLIEEYGLETPIVYNKPLDNSGSLTETVPPQLKTKQQDRDKPDFDKIIKRCKFIRHCHIDSYSLPYDHWWSLGTIAVRCSDGANIFHQLSVHYPKYTQKETDALIKSIQKSPAGPHRCDYIETKTNGVYCKMCKYKRTVKSPVSLGKRKKAKIDYAKEESEKMIEEYFEAQDECPNSEWSVFLGDEMI